MLITLMQTLPKLEAGQMARMGTTIRMAMWADQSEWSRFYTDLRRMAAPHIKNQPALIEAKDAAWFEVHGLPYLLLEDTWAPLA